MIEFRSMKKALALLLIAGAVWAGVRLSGEFSGTLEQPEIGYSTLPVTDPVEQLNRKIDAGEAALEKQPVTGYLRSVLNALNIPVESQIMVFSRTSLQERIIYPTNPRTIYSNY